MTIKKDIPLAQYSTYRIGGPAKYFCEVRNEDELRDALVFAKTHQLRLLFLMGGGSNLIIADKGFDGLVIKAVNTDYAQDGLFVRAGGGVSMAHVVKQTTEAGLQGLEWAGGLPGSLGGAIFGNAGAFGGEIKDNVISVKAAHIKEYEVTIKEYTNEECAFSYRNSLFKRQGNYLILEVVMKFSEGKREELERIAQEKMEYRQTRHPLEYPNIGSIFKNIDDSRQVARILEKFPELEYDVNGKWHGKVPTAVLVQKAGLQGKRIGGAQISEKHANFIINRENATATDVANLIKEVKETIHAKFGIALEEEVRYIGF